MNTVIHNGLEYKIGLHGKPYYYDADSDVWRRDISEKASFIRGLINIRDKVSQLPPMPEKTLAQRAALLRKMTGLTQVELAEKVGVKKETVEELESGKCKRLQVRARYAYREFFGIDSYWLSTGKIK